MTITEIHNDKEDVLARKENKSMMFLLPLVGLHRSNKNIFNTYLCLNTSPVDEFTGEYLYVHVKERDGKIEKSKYFSNVYKTKENDSFIYKLNIPEKFKEDYFLFLEGKYSKMSQSAKDIICRGDKFSVSTRNSIEYKILYRTKERVKFIEDLIGEKLPRDAEVCSIMDIKSEIYDRG